MDYGHPKIRKVSKYCQAESVCLLHHQIYSSVFLFSKGKILVYIFTSCLFMGTYVCVVFLSCLDSVPLYLSSLTLSSFCLITICSNQSPFVHPRCLGLLTHSGIHVNTQTHTLRLASVEPRRCSQGCCFL